MFESLAYESSLVQTPAVQRGDKKNPSSKNNNNNVLSTKHVNFPQVSSLQLAIAVQTGFPQIIPLKLEPTLQINLIFIYIT